MKKKLATLSLTTLLLATLATPVQAVCPVCTVAVVGGLGISRLLGIDDLVSSIWIGGLLMSVSLWTADWLEKKYHLKDKFRYSDYLVILFWYGITLTPLWLADIIGHPFNTFWGADKIILGTTIGTAVFLLGVWLDKKVRQAKGKQLFVYQKIVFPISALIITSIIFLIVTQK